MRIAFDLRLPFHIFHGRLDTRPRGFGEEARWRLVLGSALVALKDVLPAQRALRAALAAEGRDWVRGRAHQELGKLADLARDRAGAIAEYRLAVGLCQADHDPDGVKQAKRLMQTGYRERSTAEMMHPLE